MAQDRPGGDSAPPEAKLETLVHVLHYAADRAPSRTAIVCDDRSVTYGEYRHGVNVLAAQLAARGAAGQRIVVLMTNSIELSMAIYAIWSIGAATVLLNPFYTERELVPLIKDAEPHLVLCEASAHEKILPIAKAAGGAPVVVLGGPGTGYADLLRAPDPGAPQPLPQPAALAALQYTGGTTGLPKGAIRTHDEFMHTVRQIE